jgi:hypothetical protein
MLTSPQGGTDFEALKVQTLLSSLGRATIQLSLKFHVAHRSRRHKYGRVQILGPWLFDSMNSHGHAHNVTFDRFRHAVKFWLGHRHNVPLVNCYLPILLKKNSQRSVRLSYQGSKMGNFRRFLWEILPLL